MSEWRIPLSDLDYGPEEEAAVLKVIGSKWLSMGPEVKAFEQQFATYIGAKHAIAVANGTAALHLSYLGLELGPGDEVIQPAINFVAAANMTVATQAIPVFADIVGVEEPTIDPAEIERLITPRTKAVLVMHYGGYLCRMADIVSICRRHKLALIEDACHAVGAIYSDPQSRPPSGKMAGSLGDIACFSFFSNKNLVTGEGGMVTTDRDELAARIRLLRSHGMTTMTWDRHKGHASSYDVLLNGFNYRTDEIKAALGRVQLEKLESNNRRRQQLVFTYRRDLAELPNWIVPFRDHPGQSAYHLMTLVAPDEQDRDEIAQILKDNGIQTSKHYPCIAGFKVFECSQNIGLDRSHSFAKRSISLPLFPHMTVSQVEEICSLIRKSAVIGHM